MDYCAKLSYKAYYQMVEDEGHKVFKSPEEHVWHQTAQVAMSCYVFHL